MATWKEEVTIIHITQEQVDADLQCYICLDDLVAGEEVMKLKCAHHYHELCISPWLDKNNICPTCRQKILCREDPDPEEYDFEFDSGFLTDIIREINNIVYGVESDEEFLYSDSPDIIDLGGSDGETILLEENITRNEINNTSEVTRASVSEDSSDHEVLYSEEPESIILNVKEQQSFPSKVSSDEESQNHQSGVKRRRSFAEVEDSSDDESGSFSDTVSLVQNEYGNHHNSLSSLNSRPKELVPCSVNRNNPVGGRKKLRKRQRRSPELDESQSNLDSSDEDFEFHSTYTTEVSIRKNEEKKQLVKGNETHEELKRGSNNKSVDKSHDDESDDGVFVFDMVEVESLVSKLLEIMNQGEDESSPNEDEEVVKTCSKEWSKKSLLNHESKGNAKKNESSDDECNEIYSNNDDPKFRSSNSNSYLSKPVELGIKDKLNNNVSSNRLTVERAPSPCQRKGMKGKCTKRKINNSCYNSDSESYECSNESPVKRKARSSYSESSNEDDSDGFENIEQIISELWSIVGQDGEESESDQTALNGGELNVNIKAKQSFSQNKESPKKLTKSQKKLTSNISG